MSTNRGTIHFREFPKDWFRRVQKLKSVVSYTEAGNDVRLKRMPTGAIATCKGCNGLGRAGNGTCRTKPEAAKRQQPAIRRGSEIRMEERKAELQQLGGRIRDNIIDMVGGDREEKELEDLKKRLILSLLFMVPLLAVEWMPDESTMELALKIVLLIPILLVNLQVFVDGFTAIRRKTPEMNTLAAIGTILALIMLQFTAAGIFLTTMALCRHSEAYVRCRLDEHLKNLLQAQPEDPQLESGSVITVKSGDVIPVDGTILNGVTAIEEEVITGERVPVKKGPGEPVFAGTRNLAEDLELEVSHCGQETAISRIIDHVTGSIATEPPIAARAERIGRLFVLAAVVLAALSALIRIASGSTPLEGVMSAGTILIIASPYAFSVGIPMSILAATVRGAKNGILIRSADILELARDINTIAMNKTGTITEGKPEISDVISLADGFNLRLAGAIEQHSTHPVGKEILRAAQEEYGSLPESEAEGIPGRGVRARVEGRVYLSGNAVFMKENGISVSLPEAEPLFTQGKSVVFYANENRVIGLVALRDAPKPVSLKAISRIEGMGIDAVMLTGDCARTSEAIRSEAGIDHVFAEIRPEEKARIIETLREHDEKLVAMVGDGMDDAEPIAKADVGIAVGAGPHINVKSADVILVADDLLDVVRAITLSRKTIRIIRQNMAFAYCYNILAIAAAASVLMLWAGPVIAPMIASLCMCASQILVVISTMRVKTTRL